MCGFVVNVQKNIYKLIINSSPYNNNNVTKTRNRPPIFLFEIIFKKISEAEWNYLFCHDSLNHINKSVRPLEPNVPNTFGKYSAMPVFLRRPSSLREVPSKGCH